MSVTVTYTVKVVILQTVQDSNVGTFATLCLKK